MSVFLQSVLAFLLVLGPLVFIHEFGHFIVAKLLRIGVPVFSLGFGPRLFGFRRGGTDYRVSAIPLGGYVRLSGDEADENRKGLPEEFLSRPKWQRFLVFVAGASFNIILAFVAFWFLFGVYGKDDVPNPSAYPLVRGVAVDSAAARAGVERGDKLIKIAGKDLQGFDVFNDVYSLEVVLSPETTKTVSVEREGQQVELQLLIGADPVYGHGSPPGWSLSWGEDIAPVIAAVSEDGPAERAGILAGDRVIGVRDREPVSEFDLRSMIEASPERELPLKIDRDGQIVRLTVVPRSEEGTGKIGVIIGLPSVHVDLGLWAAARESWKRNLSNSLMLFHVLRKMVAQELPAKSVSGPIGIAQVAREALLASPRHFIWLLGFFSLQLGILNLLPIPVLDGGHIMILVIEGLIRRELPDRLKERVLQVGFVFLLAFMGWVIFLDFQKIFS